MLSSESEAEEAWWGEGNGGAPPSHPPIPGSFGPKSALFPCSFRTGQCRTVTVVAMYAPCSCRGHAPFMPSDVVRSALLIAKAPSRMSDLPPAFSSLLLPSSSAFEMLFEPQKRSETQESAPSAHEMVVSVSIPTISPSCDVVSSLRVSLRDLTESWMTF